MATSTVVRPTKDKTEHSKSATNLLTSAFKHPHPHPPKATPEPEADAANRLQRRPESLTAAQRVEGERSPAPQDAASSKTSSNLRRRSAAAAATAKRAGQLPIVTRGALRQVSGDLQFQGIAVKSSTGARRRRKPFPTFSTTISDSVKPQRRGCDRRHPLGTLFTMDSAKKCAHDVLTPKVPLIASEIAPIAKSGQTQ